MTATAPTQPHAVDPRPLAPEPPASSPMPALLCIGDAVVDVFTERALAYPGGNALNVAAYSRLLHGRPASFIGILGDDAYGDHISATLTALGVGQPTPRRAHGPTGQAWVRVAPDGDRVFVGSNRGGVQHTLRLRLTDDDLATAAAAGSLHTSVYSSLDDQLGPLAEVARLSYDFSDAPDLRRVEPVAPHLDVAFVSAAGLDEDERERYGEAVLGMGARCVVLTAGSRGSLALTAQGERLSQGVEAAEVVDTLGAGDAFISGFLLGRRQGLGLGASLGLAARSGAAACAFPGAFGHATTTTQVTPPPLA